MGYRNVSRQAGQVNRGSPRKLSLGESWKCQWRLVHTTARMGSSLATMELRPLPYGA